MARVGEEFPLECPACGGDIRLIASRTARPFSSLCSTASGMHSRPYAAGWPEGCPRRTRHRRLRNSSFRTTTLYRCV